MKISNAGTFDLIVFPLECAGLSAEELGTGRILQKLPTCRLLRESPDASGRAPAAAARRGSCHTAVMGRTHIRPAASIGLDPPSGHGPRDRRHHRTARAGDGPLSSIRTRAGAAIGQRRKQRSELAAGCRPLYV